MQRHINVQEIFIAVGYFIFIGLIYLSFIPLLGSPYILDDASNLAQLAVIGDLDDHYSYLRYIFSGFAGPTGRPVSLASFLLTDHRWPTPPYGHRLINLHIHILNTLLLTLLVLRIARLYQLSALQKVLILTLPCLWAILPVNSGVVVSVIQRMTSLSALFSLLTMFVFVHWRTTYFLKSIYRDVFAIFCICIFLLLSMFSKENGVLTVGYILLIECFLRGKFIKAPKIWLSFIRLTTVVYILGILFVNLYYGLDADSWNHRDHTFNERWISQLVIIPDYFFKILAFQISGVGILQGMEPISVWFTLPKIGLAVIFWSGLIGLLFTGRLFIFSALFFLNGHFLESLFLPLEPYFEHRNYLSSIAVLLLIGIGIDRLIRIRNVFVLIPIAAFCMLIPIFYQNNKIMANPLNATKVFAVEHPDSFRAIHSFIYVLLNYGRFDEAESLRNYLSGNDQLSMGLLINCSRYGKSDMPDYQLDDSVSNLAALVKESLELYVSAECDIKFEALEEFAYRILKLPEINSQMKMSIFWLLGDAYFRNGQYTYALGAIDEAIAIKPRSDIYVTKAIWLIQLESYSLASEAVKTGLNAPSECNLWSLPCDKELIELMVFIDSKLEAVVP